MELAFRELGGCGKPSMVILHGLVGSSRNWLTAGRDLAEDFHVYALDLRNHGDSPEADFLDFPEMAGDVFEFLDKMGIEQTHLLGHSIGGKVAMRMAMDQPERMTSLIVADIAPRDYGLHFKEDFEAMLALDMSSLKTRRDADEALSEAIPDWAHRQFLLTNLTRSKDGQFRWMLNIQALLDSLPTIRNNSLADSEIFYGKTLFLAGEQSNYIRTQDHDAIKRHFPNAQIVTVPGTGHNIHVDDRGAFVSAIQGFVTKQQLIQ